MQNIGDEATRQANVQPILERQERNQQILIGAVQAEVQSRLGQSLYAAILHSAGKTEETIFHSRPWQGQLSLQNGDLQPVSVLTSITSVFEHPDVDGRLLILGRSGSGKTTALLELAAELIERARHDGKQPIPVLFHLSSWQVDQQSFEDWLRTEMRLKYGVSQRLCNLWLKANILLPLLDGLDAASPRCQPSTAQQINERLKHVPGPLVIACCAEACDRLPIPLSLNGTLELEPLAPEHLKQFLTALGLDDLWVQLKQFPGLLDLVRTPLWLSLLILTWNTPAFALWETSHKSLYDWQNSLIDGFILQQLHQPLNHDQPTLQKSPTLQQRRHWLGWLARQIQDQAEHEFLIEKMQPFLLSNRKQIVLYSLLGGLIFGLSGGLVFGLLVDRGSGIFVASIITVLFIARRRHDAIAVIEDSKPTVMSLMKFIFVRQLNQVLPFLLLGFLVVAIDAQGVGSFIATLAIFLVFGLLLRLIIAIPSWLVGGIIFGINRMLDADIAVRTEPNQQIREILLYSLRAAAMFVPFLIALKIIPLFWSGPIADTVPIEVSVLLHNLGVIAAIALWATIFDSALICAQHLALRLVLCWANLIPWNYARFLDACCDRSLLQRVGGRYQFIHPLIQKRFAMM